jgi:hypothetical protein
LIAKDKRYGKMRQEIVLKKVIICYAIKIKEREGEKQ